MAPRSVMRYPETLAPFMPILNKYRTQTLLYRVLYWIGVGGLSTRPDIALAMGLDMSTRRAKDTNIQRIGRACKVLKEENLICADRTKFWLINKFYMLRLSDNGVNYCRNTFGWDLIKSDWDKLILWHNGELYPEHSAMVLNFAFHARLRGWDAIVIPHDLENSSEPDVMISKGDEKYFVEVERQAWRVKAKQSKWDKQNLVQGRLAACYVLSDSAFHTTGSFIFMGYSKFDVTSLEYLQKSAYNQPGPGRLWQYISEEYFDEQS